MSESRRNMINYMVVCVNDYADRHAVVSGPIANDDLALLFRQFELGLATVEMLVREMRFKQLTIQYSFHTEPSVNALRFEGADDVY